MLVRGYDCCGIFFPMLSICFVPLSSRCMFSKEMGSFCNIDGAYRERDVTLQIQLFTSPVFGVRLPIVMSAAAAKRIDVNPGLSPQSRCPKPAWCRMLFNSARTSVAYTAVGASAMNHL